MKLFAALIFSIFLSNAYAFSGQDVCPDAIKETDSLLICHKEAFNLMSKENKVESLKESLPFETIGHLSLGYPDDSTDFIYNYAKTIKNKSGKLIGYMDIFAIANSEAGWRTQFHVFYSLKGQVVAATARDF